MSSFPDAKDGLTFCLVGPSRVGKSAILSALEKKPFVEKYFSTIRLSKSVIDTKINGQSMPVTIKDGPGPLELLSISLWSELVEHCDGVIYVFDVTNEASLAHLEVYTKKVCDTNPYAKTILLGNKVDSIVYQEVDEEKAERQARIYQCDGGYMEVSAKRGLGLSEAIDRLASACLGITADRVVHSRSSSSPMASPFVAAASPIATSERRPSAISGISPGVRVRRGLTTQQTYRGSIGRLDSSQKYHDLAQWYIQQHERDNFLDSIREKLAKGFKVLMYPHSGGPPSPAVLSLTYPFTCFTFIRDATGFKEIIVIDDVCEIRPYTETSYTFKCMNIPRACEGKDHLFTVIASEKSVSLAAMTPEQCVYIVKGLKLIMECAIPHNIKKLRGKDSFSEEKLLKIMQYRNGETENIEFVENVKFKLKQGIDVLYVRRNGKYKERIMSLDSTDRRLVFLRRRENDIAVKLTVVESFLIYFEGPDAGMDLDDIAEIRPGYTSAKFAKIEPPPDPSQEHLACSFISSERTIAILMKNEREREFITGDFLAWLHSTRMSSTIY